MQTVKRYPFDFGCGRGPSELDIQRIAEHLQLRDTGMAADSLGHTVDSLTAIFYEKEAFLLTTHIVERIGGGSSRWSEPASGFTTRLFAAADGRAPCTRR